MLMGKANQETRMSPAEALVWESQVWRHIYWICFLISFSSPPWSHSIPWLGMLLDCSERLSRFFHNILLKIQMNWVKKRMKKSKMKYTGQPNIYMLTPKLNLLTIHHLGVQVPRLNSQYSRPFLKSQYWTLMIPPSKSALTRCLPSWWGNSSWVKFLIPFLIFYSQLVCKSCCLYLQKKKKKA